MTMTKMYPGMNCNSIEFFVLDSMAKAIHKGKVIDFTEIPLGIIELLREEIKKDKEVNLILHDLYPDSEWKRLEQFVSCRFGGLDFKSDITADGQLQDGEFWDCPKRGNCPHEGKLCKLPMVNDYRLTETDVKLMQLSTSEMTNEHIASELEMPLGSFHKAKAFIHSLLGVQTKQGITKVCIFFGLI